MVYVHKADLFSPFPFKRVSLSKDYNVTGYASFKHSSCTEFFLWDGREKGGDNDRGAKGKLL